MPKVHVTRLNGQVQTLEADTNISLMNAIRDAGIGDILAICGGCRSCATCHVHVDPQWFAKLPQMSSDENELLDASDHRTAHSRLSCQILLTDEVNGLRVEIPPEG